MRIEQINVRAIENGYLVEISKNPFYHNDVYTPPVSFYIQSLEDLVEELDRYAANQ